MITFSIISHHQLELVEEAMLSIVTEFRDAKFIITINKPENERIIKRIKKNFKNVKFITNRAPKGYGANHNQAFNYSNSKFFCVCNPDIKLRKFNLSIEKFFKEYSKTAFISAKICNKQDELEDNIRDFPSSLQIIKRFLGSRAGENKYMLNTSFDWCAGMFMIFDSTKYSKVRGFDEKFFMYYEDADICRRIGDSGYDFFILDNILVEHDARRGSRKNIKLLAMHVKSALIFLIKSFFKNYRDKRGKIIKY